MGRHSKYTEKDLLEKTNEFFELCDKNRQLPEKAGLCYFLGISRDTYSEYRKKYPDAVKEFDNYIESSWVRRLNGQSPAGAIFYLKNAFKENWKDHQTTDITSGGEKIQSAPVISLDLEKLDEYLRDKTTLRGTKDSSRK